MNDRSVLAKTLLPPLLYLLLRLLCLSFDSVGVYPRRPDENLCNDDEHGHTESLGGPSVGPSQLSKLVNIVHFCLLSHATIPSSLIGNTLDKEVSPYNFLGLSFRPVAVGG